MVKTREEITTNIEDMKQYLKDVYSVTKEWVCTENAIQEINNKINSLGLRADLPIPPDVDPKFHEVLRKRNDAGMLVIFSVIFGVVGLIAGGIIGLIIVSTLDLDSDIFVIFPIIGVIGGIIFTIVCSIKDNKAIDAKYRSMVQDYNKELEEANKRAESELAEVPRYQELMSIYEKNRIDCLNTLKQLFDLEIIFPKYREFIPISQIYEYFMSGRCTELEGPDGAYNLYEKEMRQNVIITELNIIISNLERIKQTQYMVYEAINESNRILANIESNTAAIAYNTATIAQNSEIVARYYR